MDMNSCKRYWGLFKNFKKDILKMWLRFTPFDGKAVYHLRSSSMGYIHCCGALRKTRTFRIVPQGDFMLCELDYLSKCPVCGHTVVQLTRIRKNDDMSVIRRINKKAKKFFKELRLKILYEIKAFNYDCMRVGKFYLNYNEYGVQKRCYSNLSKLKMGISENKSLHNP